MMRIFDVLNHPATFWLVKLAIGHFEAIAVLNAAKVALVTMGARSVSLSLKD